MSASPVIGVTDRGRVRRVGGEAGGPGRALRGLLRRLGLPAAGWGQQAAGQPAVEGRAACPEAESGQLAEQAAGPQVRVLGESLAAVVGEDVGEQARPRDGPDSGCPALVQVGADGLRAVAELPGDGAHRHPGRAQGEDLLDSVWGQHRP